MPGAYFSDLNDHFLLVLSVVNVLALDQEPGGQDPCPVLVELDVEGVGVAARVVEIRDGPNEVCL